MENDNKKRSWWEIFYIGFFIALGLSMCIFFVMPWFIFFYKTTMGQEATRFIYTKVDVGMFLGAFLVSFIFMFASGGLAKWANELGKSGTEWIKGKIKK